MAHLKIELCNIQKRWSYINIYQLNTNAKKMERKTGFRDKSRTITLSPLFLCSKGVQTKMSSDIVVITLKRNPQQYFCGTFTTNIRTKYQPTLFPVICYQNQPRALLQCSLNIELGYCFNATQKNK